MIEREGLAAVLRAAAAGSFPEPDGGWTRARPWRSGLEGAIAFTGHGYLAVGDDVSDAELDALGANGLGGLHHPRLVATLAGSGEIDHLDALLVASGTGLANDLLVDRDDLADHPRAVMNRTLRHGVRVLGSRDPAERTLVTLSRGIAGLTEIGIERDPADPTPAAAFLRAARAQLPTDDLLLAAISPGNARSIRLFQREGFVPIGSVQLWRPKRAAA